MKKFNLYRPKTLKEVVELTNKGNKFRFMLSEFLDSYYTSKEINREHFFIDKPDLLNKKKY